MKYPKIEGLDEVPEDLGPEWQKIDGDKEIYINPKTNTMIVIDKRRMEPPSQWSLLL